MKYLDFLDYYKKFKPNKNECMKYHFLKRFKQRFRTELSEEDYNKIIVSIKRSKENARFLYKQSNTRSVYKIKYMNIEFAVIYNKERKQLHTCFPLNWLNEDYDPTCIIY